MFRLTRPASPPLDNATSSDADAATCRQQAALSQSSRKLARHHPSVKLPPRMEEKPKREQIQRCCDRFKSHPLTVDTLIRSLFTIRNNPSEGKYRRINCTHPGYQRSLAKVPGAEQLLFALGFTRTPRDSLFLARVDQQLLSLALGILEKTKETPEYRQAKREQVFAKEVTAQLRAGSTPTETEQANRQELLSRIPTEPSSSRGAVMMIQVLDTTLTRRFDGDDTLQDVLNWLGGTAGTAFKNKLMTSEWSLVDVNRQGPQVPMDCPANQHKTLQHLGFWPSGRLVLRPSLPGAVAELGTSRGLGSAPSETLQY